ncbi:MAG: phosphoribosylanthranilate isomerase [Balneolales bacterium]
MSEPTRLKICGNTTLEDARYAAGAMADYLGFIFFPGSPRFVSPAIAAEIIGWIEGPEKVGVFVNQSVTEVNGIIDKTGIDLAQLHGDETPEYARKIKKPVIKALRLKSKDDFQQLPRIIEEWQDVASYLLFDAFHAVKYGGTGEKSDWDALSVNRPDFPFFLAGGITTDNVSEAVQKLRPFAIDLTSSLESTPGIKDLDKMERFFDRWHAL